MFLVPKSPIVIPTTERPPENVLDGTLGIYAKDDGLHIVDKNNNDKTLITEPIFNNATKEKDTALAVGGYSKIAIDVSHYAGGWEIDGIYIAVSPENLETFQHAEYIWVTYRGERLKLRRSNFLEEMTIEQMWGERLDNEPLIPIMDYQVFSYNNADFNFMEGGLIRENLEPICVHDNVFEVKNNGEVKSPTIEDLYQRADVGVIVCAAEGEHINVNDSAELPLKNLKVLGKTNQKWKNLIPYPYSDGDSDEQGGLTVTVQEDGGIKVKGTVTGIMQFYLFEADDTYRLPVEAGTYTFFNYGDSTFCRFRAVFKTVDDTKTVNIDSNGNHLSAELSSDYSWYLYNVQILCTRSYTEIDDLLYLSIEKGTEPTSYEKNAGIVASPENPLPMNSTGAAGSLKIEICGGDDDPKSVVAVPTPSGLSGVPVRKNGNHTDENGQQWVCDEIDFDRNMLIKRVDEYEVDVDEAVHMDTYILIVTKPIPFEISDDGGLWNMGAHIFIDSPTIDEFYTEGGMAAIESYTDSLLALEEDELFTEAKKRYNGSKMLLVMKEPIEIPLSEEQINAYKKIIMYKPYTTISNDGGAYLSAEYIADTKTYIDNKFAELQTAIISTGGNV